LQPLATPAIFTSGSTIANPPSPSSPISPAHAAASANQRSEKVQQMVRQLSTGIVGSEMQLQEEDMPCLQRMQPFSASAAPAFPAIPAKPAARATPPTRFQIWRLLLAYLDRFVP